MTISPRSFFSHSSNYHRSLFFQTPPPSFLKETAHATIIASLISYVFTRRDRGQLILSLNFVTDISTALVLMCPLRPGPFFRKINWQSSKIYQHITRLGDKLMQWGNQLCFCHWGATAQPRTEPDKLDHCESDFCGRCGDLCFYLDRGHKSEWVTSAVLPPLESHTTACIKHIQHTHKVHIQTQKREQIYNHRHLQKRIRQRILTRPTEAITSSTEEWKMHIRYCVEEKKKNDSTILWGKKRCTADLCFS